MKLYEQYLKESKKKNKKDKKTIWARLKAKAKDQGVPIAALLAGVSGMGLGIAYQSRKNKERWLAANKRK